MIHPETAREMPKDSKEVAEILKAYPNLTEAQAKEMQEAFGAEIKSMKSPDKTVPADEKPPQYANQTPEDSLIAEIKARYPDLTDDEIREHLAVVGGANYGYTKLEMLPIDTPVLLDSGSIARLSSTADGGAKIETFSPETKSWKEGGATAGDFLPGKFSDVTPDVLSKLGLSPEDIA